MYRPMRWSRQRHRSSFGPALVGSCFPHRGSSALPRPACPKPAENSPECRSIACKCWDLERDRHHATLKMVPAIVFPNQCADSRNPANEANAVPVALILPS